MKDKISIHIEEAKKAMIEYEKCIAKIYLLDKQKAFKTIKNDVDALKDMCNE